MSFAYDNIIISKTTGVYTMTRYEANKKILEILSKYIENNPEQRFIQILWNLDLINIGNSELIEDRYNEEPEITLNKLKMLHF